MKIDLTLAHEAIRPRIEVMRFARFMELALRANDHKVGWTETPLHELVDQAAVLLRESAELCDLPDEEYMPVIAAKKIADVANYLMMMYDNIVREMKPDCACGCMVKVEKDLRELRNEK